VHLRPRVGTFYLLAPIVLTAGCDRNTSGQARAGARPSSAEAPATVSTAPAVSPTGAGTVADGLRVPARVQCTADPAFPVSWDLPEASAAAEVELTPGVRELIVLADSGHNGDAMLWRIPRGPLRTLKLSLDPSASDDLEGAAWRGGHLYTLTSSGGVRRFSPDSKGGLLRDQDAYALGARPASCPSLADGNCGRNYEGLCLRGASLPGLCAGYAASKTSGTLYCLAFLGDRLAIDQGRPPLKLDLQNKALSDCAFGAEGGPAQGTLLVTTNVYGGAATYIVGEADGALHPIDVQGTLTNEAIAVDKDGSLYQFMDDNHDTSPAIRTTCTGW
jgi:hypothetical protein